MMIRSRHVQRFALNRISPTVLTPGAAWFSMQIRHLRSLLLHHCRCSGKDVQGTLDGRHIFFRSFRPFELSFLFPLFSSPRVPPSHEIRAHPYNASWILKSSFHRRYPLPRCRFSAKDTSSLARLRFYVAKSRRSAARRSRRRSAKPPRDCAPHLRKIRKFHATTILNLGSPTGSAVTARSDTLGERDVEIARHFTSSARRAAADYPYPLKTTKI